MNRSESKYTEQQKSKEKKMKRTKHERKAREKKTLDNFIQHRHWIILHLCCIEQWNKKKTAGKKKQTSEVERIDETIMKTHR